MLQDMASKTGVSGRVDVCIEHLILAIMRSVPGRTNATEGQSPCVPCAQSQYYFMTSRKEMVSLVSATQNEVAKAAMDAWARFCRPCAPSTLVA